MQRYPKRSSSLSTFINEHRDRDSDDHDQDQYVHSRPRSPPPPLRTAQSPPRLSFKHHHNNLLFSPTRPTSPPPSSNNNFQAQYSIIPPPSPESPWTLSPHHTPSPSLLYHCIASLHRQDGTIFSIAATKGLVFTGSESPRVRAWRQPDCTERGYFKSRHGDIRSIVCHGNTLFTSHKDHKVRAWNVTSSSTETFQVKKIGTLPKISSFLVFSKSANAKHKDCISCMAYNHSEGLLYTGSWDRTVKAWRVSDNRLLDSFTAHDDQINAIVVNQDDGCVFTCSSDGSVKIWRRVYGQSSHTLTMTLKFQPSPVNALALSSVSTSSCFLYSGSSDGFINFWEKEKMSGRYNHGGFLQGHRFSVLCLVAIEKLLFSGSEDTTIRVWRREEGSCYHECLAVIDAHRGPVKCLAAVMEIEKVVVMGFLVYSSGLDQTFKVWRIKVLPEEKDDRHDRDHCVVVEDNNNHNHDKMHQMRRVSGEFEMISPVLSPSWVEKKLTHGNSHHPFGN